MDKALLTLRDETALQLMVPPNLKHWGVEKWERGAWVRQQWQEASDANTKPTMHFAMDSLSLETLRDRWGSGIYRLVFSRGPGKRRKGESRQFQLLEEGDDDAPELAAAAPAVASTSSTPRASSPANGHANGHANGNGAALSGLPTGRNGQPPIVATGYPNFVATRDQSPMETFMSMFALMREQMAEQRAHEERRSREFMAMMALREKVIESDAAVRIAQASASASASQSATQHMADTLRAELDNLRSLAAQAQQAAAEGGGGGQSAELAALLAELGQALEVLTGDDDDDENMDPAVWGPVVAGLVDKVAGPIGDAVARRIAGGAMPPEIAAAVDSAVRGGSDGS